MSRISEARDGRTDWVQRLMRLPRKGHMTYTVECFMRDDPDRSSFRSSYRYYQHCGIAAKTSDNKFPYTQ